MDISNDIAASIERAKALPNSLERNKLISHLHDALVWAERLENTHAQPKAEAQCTCPAGGLRRDCPVHKQP